ncbi:hypothetical protein AB1L30_08575 [Bremerella sp. JC817]|uniref:hypothetical protein n=1 Tax=Bremerella sp. JC817 TaxID=3231756 RepID=UPI003457A0D3
MTPLPQKAIAKAILNNHGQTYAQQAGIRLRDAPAPLFQLLSASVLMSSPVENDKALQATAALRKAALDTPKKMAEASRDTRAEVIGTHGYEQLNLQGSKQLGKTAEFLLRRYYGDLRQLRAEAGHDVAMEHRLLRQFNGVGKSGADIFLREIQGLWHEVYPYADDRVMAAARKLNLPGDAFRLSRLVARVDFPRLVAGIDRIAQSDHPNLLIAEMG